MSKERLALVVDPDTEGTQAVIALLQKEAKTDGGWPKPFLPHDLIQKIRSFLPKTATQKGAIEAPEPPSEFPHAGYLTDVAFIRLVFFIFSRKETGTLRLQNADTKKLVT